MRFGRLWTGLYPTVTTQFTETLKVDLAATRKGLKALIRDGADGLVVLGTGGENTSLEPHEKRAVLDLATEVADGRLPIVAGVSEPTTVRAMDFARDAQALGADALMLLPAPAYMANEEDLFVHLRQIATATSLPIMLCNTPLARRTDFDLAFLARLASLPNIVAINECAADSQRFTDIIDAFGDRYVVMAGRDAMVMEGLALGAKGWVSGVASAFPTEAAALVRELLAGRHEQARRIHRWLLPLLHLDGEHDVVQSLKLAEQMVGRGNERVRMPRLPLSGARRSEVIAIVEKAMTTSPDEKLFKSA